MKTFAETDKFKEARVKSGATYRESLATGKFKKATGPDNPQWTGGLRAATARRIKKLVEKTGRASVPGRFDGSIDRLNELLTLDKETGILNWKRRYCSRAGSINKLGYRTIRVDGTLLPEHRVIFAMAHGRWPVDQIDHINGVPGDNRVENLREATGSQNARNTRAHRDNASGLKGVTAKRGGFIAQIYIDGKHKNLGTFSSAEDAHAAYVAAANAAFGEFARSK